MKINLKHRVLPVGLLIGLVLAAAGCSATYHIPHATFLGERTVDFRADRDEIRVGKRDGSFRAIQLAIRRNDVDIQSIRIEFENGSSQTVDFRRPLLAGTETRPIDLRGGRRIIRKVVFRYDTLGRRGGRAVVALYGLR